jgi:hypothetical protein
VHHVSFATFLPRWLPKRRFAQTESNLCKQEASRAQANPNELTIERFDAHSQWEFAAHS